MDKLFGIVYMCLALVCCYAPAMCLEGDEIVRLKKAQVDDETIQLMITEKVVETCTFTVQDILVLRKAGIGNKTIRTIIESASSPNNGEDIEYGEEIRPIKSINVKDIVYLRDNGISDEVIQSIVSRSGQAYDVEEEKAWEMLKNMGIVIDRREEYE
jgi:hypothetical protein